MSDESKPAIERVIEWAQWSIAQLAPELDPNEDYLPVLLCLPPGGGEGTVTDVTPCFRDARTKGLLGLFIGPVFLMSSPAAAALINTGWAREASREELDRPGVGRVSEHPDRREVVLITAYDGHTLAVLTADITRRAGLHPTLGPWQRTDGGPPSGHICDQLCRAFDAARKALQLAPAFFMGGAKGHG